MILRRFMQHIKEQNWFAVGLDVIVVIVGIYLGLQVQEWNDQLEQTETENILVQAMIEDLQADIETVENSISFSKNKLQTIGSFLDLLRKPKETWDTTEFYQNISIIFSIAPFYSTDGTYQQLKASGSLQFFDQILVNKMNSYDNQIKKTLLRDDIMIQAELEFLSNNEAVVNFEALSDLRAQRPISHQVYIRFDDEFTIDLFVNRIIRKQQVMLRSLEEYQVQLTLAHDLINDLNAEYPK